MADLSVGSRVGRMQRGKQQPWLTFGRALLVRLALGGFNGWFAYYVFGASNWGAFWFAFVIAFIVSRFDVLPPWRQSMRTADSTANSSS